MKQEMNKKEQQLQYNNIKINNFKKSKNLLIKGLNKHKNISDLKTKKNDELKNYIEKLKELNKMFIKKPIILQDVKKKDNKARTFAPPDKDEDLAIKSVLDDAEISKDFDIDEFFGNEKNEYVNINLNDVNNLFHSIKKC